MTAEKVRYEVDGPVAVVTIDRPEVLGAMDLDVFDGLAEAAARAGADPAVRAVMVRGAGRAFSSGLDTSIFASAMGGGGSPLDVDIASLQRSFTSFEEIAKPTVAAIAGPCFGGGLQLAIACDVRIAADDASLSVMELRWGIIPDLGATTRLPRLVGLGRAKEMILTARRVAAEEAERWGLVNRVVPRARLEEEAAAFAAELAAGPPLALAAAKRLAARAFDEPVAVGLLREQAAQRRILASADFLEAVAARVGKREPEYRGA